MAAGASGAFVMYWRRIESSLERDKGDMGANWRR